MTARARDAADYIDYIDELRASYETPAHDAAWNGHLEVVRYLHEVVPDTLSSKAEGNTTPAHYAARAGHLEVVCFLQDNVQGALSARDKGNHTPAHLAAGGGHLEVMQYLHKVVPDTLSARTNSQRTPAHNAARDGRVGVLQYLHEVVPGTLSAKDDYHTTPAHKAAEMGHLEVIRYLHEVVPETLWAENKYAVTPSHLAVINGHREVQDYLSKPWTPLMHAAAERRPQDVHRLLHQGADPTAIVTHKGNEDTALTLASTVQGEREVCSVTVDLIQGSMVWSPGSHPLFPPAFHRGVMHVLGLRLALNAKRQSNGHDHMLPNGVWLGVVMYLPRAWGICREIPTVTV